MSLAVADERGLVGPIRVHHVVVDPRSDLEGIKFNSCSAKGQTVDPCSQIGYPSCPQVCTAEQVITQQTIDVVEKRLEWLESFLSTTFRMKTSQSGVTVKQHIRDKFPYAQLNPNYDADVVVIVTMQPAHIKGVVGYASCLQSDHFGRCTVGLFNWTPDSEWWCG